MARKTKADMKVKDSPKIRTPRTPKSIRKPHLSIFAKHRNPKFDAMVRKKRAIIKTKLRVSSVQEDAHRERQEEAPSNQQQLPASRSNSPLIHNSPHDELATILQRRGMKNKGKGRADAPREPIAQEDAPVGYQRQFISTASTSSLVPDLSLNLSRDRPLGSFFEGSRNNEITGGNFHHIHGHHMNFTVQLNPSRVEEYKAVQEIPLSPTTNHGPTMPPTQDIHRSQSLPTDICDAGPSTLTSRTRYSPDNGNLIYQRHLGPKKRGFPLWIPEPNRNLPMHYRRQGVNIGDVGIITRFGGFSFLFNICLPRDNDINPPTLPAGFAPIYPPLKSTDIDQYSEFKPESFLASAEIEKTCNEPPFRGLSFSTSSAEGAVLTFPDGAISDDLANTQRFREYAKANIKEWYRYVNGHLGRGAENGALRLIVGCDKATSWGMAAVANITQNKVHHLKYCPVEGGVATAPIPLYKWEHTGFAEARVGPDLQEIEYLKTGDGSDVAVDGKYWNQSLFIRTLNLKLNPAVYAAVGTVPEAALVEESEEFYDMGSPNTSTSSPSQAATHAVGIDQQPGMHSAAQMRSTSESLRSAMDHLTLGNNTREPTTSSISPNAPNSHPADFLNDLLLQEFPNCQVVITEDKDWYSVINEDDKIMPSDSEITVRVLAAHDIREEDGAVFLETKVVQAFPDQHGIPLLDHHQTPSPRPTDPETEAYLRKSIPIAEGKAVNLWSLPDSGGQVPKISDMIKLAIWGSPNHRLTLRQIYDEIEDRYPHLKDAQDKPWQRSIRYNLSLKAMFVREERPPSAPGKGFYWTLNTAMGEGNKRDLKRKEDSQNSEDEDTDGDAEESQLYPTLSPSSSVRGTPVSQTGAPIDAPLHTHPTRSRSRSPAPRSRSSFTLPSLPQTSGFFTYRPGLGFL